MFRFTIRDVLWLTAVVTLAIGWWIDHQAVNGLFEQSHRDNLELQDHLKQLCTQSGMYQKAARSNHSHQTTGLGVTH